MNPARKLCPAEITLRLIEHRWKLVIIHELAHRPRRFSYLSRKISGVSHRVLCTHLREMGRDGLVQREVFPEIPPRVEYSLTKLGQSLKPVLFTMHKWGVRYAKRLARPNEKTSSL